MFKIINSYSFYKLKTLTHFHQRGMLLIEVILIALFLTGTALATTYFFTQTQTTMRSSSQTMTCQTIAKQALDDVVSLGSRLYGYRLNYTTNSDLSYNAFSLEGSNIELGSQFPPYLYRDMFAKLGISAGAFTPKANSGVPLFKIFDNTDPNNTDPIEISTSVLIVNSVNALQYLYNSDPEFFTGHSGKGRLFGTSDLSALEKYKQDSDLKDIAFYLKISPVNLETNEVITQSSHIQCQETIYDGSQYIASNIACPTNGTHRLIVTRPRFHDSNNVDTIAAFLKIIGNENLGFEIKALLEYTTDDDQNFSCDGMHRFSHQSKPIIKTNDPLNVTLTELKNGASPSKDLQNDIYNLSCDTEGTGYDDVSLKLSFSDTGTQIGTIILCQMNSYCRSKSDDPNNDKTYFTCQPTEGRWQPCTDIKPTEHQSWTFNFDTTNSIYQFNDMQADRRYELNIGEFSIAGNQIRTKKEVALFYLDAKRPTILARSIVSNNVGNPTDGNSSKGRNYKGSDTNWKAPPNSTSSWLQCDRSDVYFMADSTDQFIHNLSDCDLLGTRRNGNGTSSASVSKTGNPEECEGKMTGIAHGRHTVKFTPNDSCGAGTPKNLVWDTDLPNTFLPRNFASNPIWFYNTAGNNYTVDTLLPATGAGRFPKHYSVDCRDNYMGDTIRDDGDGGTLACHLGTSNPSHDDGCNPNIIGVSYYHICGQTGYKDTKWAVYAPITESCVNVQCEPNRICCDSNDCGAGVTFQHCQEDKFPHVCSNPMGGSHQDAASGCPPLGLYECPYQLPCDATNPFNQVGPTSRCLSKRQNNACDFINNYTCHLFSSSNTSGASFSGNCGGHSSQSCSVSAVCARYQQVPQTVCTPGTPSPPTPGTPPPGTPKPGTPPPGTPKPGTPPPGTPKPDTPPPGTPKPDTPIPTTQPPDPCLGVSCSNDEVCTNGSCVCPGQCCPLCASGQVCKNGSCVNRKGGSGNRPINCDNDDHNDQQCQGP